MAIKLNVGQQLDISMSTGVDADYTYSSSHPNKASVNASGIITALISGGVTILVIRNSDGATVDRIGLRVVGLDEAPDGEVVASYTIL